MEGGFLGGQSDIYQMFVDAMPNFYLDNTYDGGYVLFHIPSLSIYEVDKEVFELFKAAKEKNIERLTRIWESSSIVRKNKAELLHLLRYNASNNEEKVSRLALLITQQCGLECLYCYANHGIYYGEGKMSEKIAKETIERFYGMFDDVETVQFFGGEPLLNLNIIKIVLDFLVTIGKFPKINIESGLGVYSNVVLSLIDLVKKYEKWFRFEIVASIDGPDFIQDRLRPFKGGKGSYNIVSENVKLLRTIEQPKAIEVTYTRLHEEKGMSKRKLKEFFSQNFEIENLIVIPVLTNDSTLAVNMEETYKCEKHLDGPLRLNYKSLPEEIKKEIETLSNAIFNVEPSEYYCGAGVNNFVVDIKGDVYPCQMVVGRKEFKISNVKKDLKDFKKDIIKARNIFVKYVSKMHDEECSKCFLRYSCGGCVFADVYLGISGTPGIPHVFCERKSEIARKLLKAKFWEVLQ